jgi:hypothetical protein
MNQLQQALPALADALRDELRLMMRDDAHPAARAVGKKLYARIKPLLEQSVREHDSSVSAQVDGVSLIAAERARQVAVEGWTREHDAQHGAEALALAGAAYACRLGYPGWAERMWPFDDSMKPKDMLRNLVRAGALIAAAIDLHTAPAAPAGEVMGGPA